MASVLRCISYARSVDPIPFYQLRLHLALGALTALRREFLSISL